MWPFSRKPKVNVCDLIYAYSCVGKPWVNTFGEYELPWNLNNCFDDCDFTNARKRVISLGIMEQTEDGKCALTEFGANLLKKHDYIPLVVKDCMLIPVGHSRMFVLRELHPDLTKYEVILNAVTEQAFIDCYVDPEPCYDNKAEMQAAIDDAKRRYNDFDKNIEMIIEKDQRKEAKPKK